ncbi:MAG: hypothetical protein U0361_24245, partial [Nitrospiraceae bacterium]
MSEGLVASSGMQDKESQGNELERANEALARAFFSGRFQGRPVFLTLDNRARSEVANELGLDVDEAEAHCCDAVGRYLDAGKNPYRDIIATAREWEKAGHPGFPPFVAVLFALSHAAELMGEQDEFAHNNYYVRLAQVLGFPRDPLVKNGKSTDMLWGILARWLEEQDYERGQPTASSIGNWKYVGKAMSQAIVRANDRHLFHDLFERNGFAPGDRASPDQMLVYLADWMRTSKPSPRIKNAWGKLELRPRIAEISASELEEWSEEAAAGGNHGEVATRFGLTLLATIVPSFPKPRLSLALGQARELPVALEGLKDANENVYSLSNEQYGSFATLSPSPLGAGARALGSNIHLQAPNLSLGWRSGLVIPLAPSIDGPYWTEVQRVARNVAHMLLVKDKKVLLEELGDILRLASTGEASVAASSDLPGLPGGWLLFRDVCITASSFEASDDLQVLVPLSDELGFSITGGTQLGRGIYHSDDPPAVLFTSKSGPTRVHIMRPGANGSAIIAASEDGRPLFYFGRYTGATLGGTFVPPARLKAGDRNTINDVGQEIRKIAQEAASLRKSMVAAGKAEAAILEALSQFQDPYCGEMLSRWDMAASPPDILITNTSMLNIMLLRDIEAPIFQKTREWLEADPSRKFTLVVDELHGYRGTQGTEVALLVRNLLDRLGLEADSGQLRCIATSASLDGDTGGAYLEEFFGVDRSTFAIYPGKPRQFETPLPIDSAPLFAEKEHLLGEDKAAAEGATSRLLKHLSPREVLASACSSAGAALVKVNGHEQLQEIVRPAYLSKVKDTVFGEGASSELLDALFAAAILEGRGSWEEPKPTFRSHMFMRQVQGVWACSNPDCSEVEERFRSPKRRIGRLFRSPALKCSCGGQVLELLYCYDCGEAFLGGYVVESKEEALKGMVFLEATKPVEGGGSPGMVYERPHDEFRWYWPGGSIPQGAATWSHGYPGGQGQGTLQFQAARLDPYLGQLVPADPEPTGIAMAAPTNLPSGLKVAGLPETCPRCLSSYDYFNSRDLKAFYGGTVQTPIRGLRTGLNATTQLIADRSMLATGDGLKAEKMIAFTDSRDDAADLAAGLELHHFRDLVRQL